jgi:hypothetical protein
VFVTNEVDLGAEAAARATERMVMWLLELRLLAAAQSSRAATAWTKRLRRGMGERSESVLRAGAWTFRMLRLIPSSFRPLWPELFVPAHERVSP